MYSIIDIETTGTSYKNGKITEIAILIHDGTKIIDEFTTLINPEQKIPYRITQLTGINNKMVEDAPKFYEVARKVVEMTEDCIFVAHNVNFDFNFIRQEFKYLGYEFNREKLCTVKLSRKLIPFKRSYSLGNLCNDLNIGNPHRHRAWGDARATATLFEMLLSIDPNPAEISLQGLNSNLNPAFVKELPEETGVYYFLDDTQNIIYVGKSKNIRSRIVSHLNNCTTRRALEMKNKVAHIDFDLTGSEMVALLLESNEINRYKPLYNRAQRRSSYNYGIFHHIDNEGYLNLKLEKIDSTEDKVPMTTFTSHMAAKNFLFNLCEENQLCQKLCGLYVAKSSCFQYKIKECRGACIGEENPADYNKRIQVILDKYQYKNNSFLVLDKGRNDDESSVVMIEQGKYIGFGFVDRDSDLASTTQGLCDCIKKYPENKYIHSIIRSYLHKNKNARVIDLSNVFQ